MFCSEMPNWKKRSGYRSWKRKRPLEYLRSPVRRRPGGPRRRARRACRRGRAGRRRLEGRAASSCPEPAARRGARVSTSHLPSRPEVLERRLLVLRAQVAEVPADLALHERDALALDGVGDHDGRWVGSSRSLAGAARREAPTSWPSTSWTSQPKARHLSRERLDPDHVVDLAVEGVAGCGRRSRSAGRRGGGRPTSPPPRPDPRAARRRRAGRRR